VKEAAVSMKYILFLEKGKIELNLPDVLSRNRGIKIYTSESRDQNGERTLESCRGGECSAGKDTITKELCCLSVE